MHTEQASSLTEFVAIAAGDKARADRGPSADRRCL